MLSQDCIRQAPVFGVLAAMLLLTACASGPQERESAGGDPNMQPVMEREIPPQAQTLYEQAVAAMASGGGPINVTLAFVSARANPAFSDKNP